MLVIYANSSMQILRPWITHCLRICKSDQDWLTGFLGSGSNYPARLPTGFDHPGQ